MFKPNEMLVAPRKAILVRLLIALACLAKLNAVLAAGFDLEQSAGPSAPHETETSARAPSRPASVAPAAGSGSCNPSCVSRAPSSRDRRRQVPSAELARCGRAP